MQSFYKMRHFSAIQHDTTFSPYYFGNSISNICFKFILYHITSFWVINFQTDHSLVKSHFTSRVYLLVGLSWALRVLENYSWCSENYPWLVTLLLLHSSPIWTGNSYRIERNAIYGNNFSIIFLSFRRSVYVYL